MQQKRWPITALDSLRGIAAMGVALTHFAQQEIPFCNQGILGRWLWQLGVWGVTVFFVLSGFCIHGAYLRERRRNPSGSYDWIEYLQRRFLRIYPGMIVALVLSATVGLFWTTAMVRNPNLRGFLGHIFLFSNFDSVNHQSINSILWTAIVECYFYLLYPFLILGFSRWGRWRFLVLVAVFCWGYFFLVSYLTVPGETRVMWQHTFLGLWWKWCLGVGVAEIYLSETESSRLRVVSRPIVLFAILIVSFTPCLFSDVHHVLGFHRFVLPFVVATGILGIATSPARFFEFPLLQWIGRISYSIYLFHPLVLVGFSLVTLGAWWWDLLPFLFLAVATGAAGYYLVEVPGMRLKTKKVTVPSAIVGTSLS